MPRVRAALGTSARWLLVVSGLFGLSVSLSNTFVNIYLWKVDQSFASIGWYNLGLYTCIPLMFIAAGALAKRRGSVLVLRIGLVCHVCFYALTLFGGTYMARLPALLGGVLGAASGFYWCGFNELTMRYTDNASRDRFYGMNGVVGSVAGMIAPPVAGFLISLEDRFGGLSGYHLVFGLSLAMFVLAGFVSTRLHVEAERGHLDWSAARWSWRFPVWRRTLLACFVYGWREGLFMFLIGLLMYIATDSELELGEFLLLQSGLSFLSFFIVGRLTTPHNRIRVLGIGAAGMAAAALLFLLPLRAVHLVWYGSIMAVCLPLFIVPMQGAVFSSIARLEGSRLEYIILREVFANTGRVLGILLFIGWVFVDPSGHTIPRLALGIGFVQLGAWLLLRPAAGRRPSDPGPPRLTRAPIRRERAR
ncbi:MAG: MFS transporter [Alicyclobacillus sp.]|nr:MFS transporter [Alicyclobacillus sp.]